MLHSFDADQKKFLQQISQDQDELDWVQIPGYVSIAEKRVRGAITGMAGVTIRHGIIPSLFIAVAPAHRGKGIASELMTSLLSQWKGIMFLTYYRKKTHLGPFYASFGFKKIIDWPGGRVLCVRF